MLSHLIRRSNLTAALVATTVAASAQSLTPTYPPAARGDHIDSYHGIAVPDPYRWMEDIDSPATRAWVEAEGRLTSNYLAAIPGRQAIAEELEKIWNFERWSPPERHGVYWFYTHNDGLQNQSLVFVTPDPNAPARVLLDPNALSKDGTLALRQTSISDDGRLFAYALSEAGSDWQIWHVKDVVTGKDLADDLRWSKEGGGSWRKDGSGFYYTRYDAPQPGETLKAANKYEKLYFHKLGTPQTEDSLVYARADDPDWFVDGRVTDDGHYLVIQANHGDEVQNTLLVQDLSGSGEPVKAIIPEPSAVYNFIGSIGTTFYVLTDDQAARYRIVAIDLGKPERANWRTVVPEAAETLDSASLVGGQLIGQYLKNAHSAVRRYSSGANSSAKSNSTGSATRAAFGAAPGIARRTMLTAASRPRPASIASIFRAARAACGGSLRSKDLCLRNTTRLRRFTPAKTALGCPCSSPPAKARSLMEQIRPSFTAMAVSICPWSRHSRPPWRVGFNWAEFTSGRTCGVAASMVALGTRRA